MSEWYPIIRYGVQHRWRCFQEYPCSLRDMRAWGNLIAFHDRDGFLAAIHASRQLAKEATGLLVQSRRLARQMRGVVAQTLRRVGQRATNPEELGAIR